MVIPTATPTPTVTETHMPTITPSLTPTAMPIATPTPQGRTVIVTSAADSGSGTLRQALLSAHSGDSITFDPAVFPPKAPVTIALASGLPPINQGYLTVDASNAGVILDGSKIQETSTNGLSIPSNGNAIRGLQIVRFPSTGVALHSGAQNNTIGGDQHIGTVPLGQGNLVSGNKGQGIIISDGASHNTIVGNYVGTDVSGTAAWGNIIGIEMNVASYNQVIGNLVSSNTGGGIQLWGTSTTHDNTISGNRIGTDASGGNALGIQSIGVGIHDGASHNIIGPDNLIAYNRNGGILVTDPSSLYNTVTRNSIHDNDGGGIGLLDGGNMDLQAPYFLEFDLGAGAVTGWAGANRTVEIFSESRDEGKIYEGQTTADGLGDFAFHKSASFAGPRLTATATDADGNTSEFSNPISGIRKLANLQEENSLPKIGVQVKRSKELADSRIGFGAGTDWSMRNAPQALREVTSSGIKRVYWTLNEAETESNLGGTIVGIDWSESEFYIPPDPGGVDDFATGLVNNGIISTYMLTFWDKANHPGGWQPVSSRFKTEEEIQRYLDYVRFIVRHFKGRIQYYEIWGEPDRGSPLQYIEVADYINLVKRTVPVIRQEDPEAKIVVGGLVLQEPQSRDYLFSILRSDVMPLVDAVSWHPMFGVSPEYLSEYYYEYPSIVQEIKDVASAHGFKGEYRGDALSWRSPDSPWSFPGDPLYSNTVAAKYSARGIVMHLGMDLTAGGGASSLRAESFAMVRNLCTLMDGAKPSSISLEIQSTVKNTRSYSFSLPDGSQLVALWTDGVAIDDDPGVKATVTIQDVSAQKVMGIDVLKSFEQPLTVSREGSNLVIRGLLIKDYPIFVRLVR